MFLTIFNILLMKMKKLNCFYGFCPAGCFIMALENPAAGLLLWGAGGPQIQAGDGSPADGFALEFGSEINVFSIDFADAKRLRGLLGERLYEQVVRPFPIQIVSGIAVDVGEDGVDLFLCSAVERAALGRKYSWLRSQCDLSVAL